MSGRLPAMLLVLAAGLSPVAVAHAQAPDPDCRVVFGEADVEALFAQLTEAAAGGPCALIGFSTDRAISRAEYALPDGRRTIVVLAPHACFGDEPHPRVGEIRAILPDGFERSCPTSRRALSALDAPPPSVIGVPGDVTGAAPTLARPWPGLAVLLALLLVAVLQLRTLRLSRSDLPVVFVAAGGFALALGVRASLSFAMSRWFADVPLDFPWDDRALGAANVILGAAHVPLVVGLMHAKGVGARGAAITAVLIALAPYHVRLSISPSAEVISTTCILVAALLWLRGRRSAQPVHVFVAFMLVAGAIAVSLDSVAPAILVPLFALLRDRRHEARGGWTPRVAAGVALLYYGALALFAWGAWHFLAVPLEEAMPSWNARWEALGVTLPSIFAAATHPPHFVAATSAYLFLLGLVGALVWRPRMTLAAGLFVFGACFLSGHAFFGDELLGVEGLMAALCIMHVPGGALLERALLWSERRLGFGRLAALSPLLAPAVVVGLAFATFAQVRPAYERRYTFQDEYDFLRGELAQLPPDCAVYQVSPRGGDLGPDLDCCLDAGRSPLVLAFPGLSFRAFDERSVTHRLGAVGAECTAYFESAVCSVQETGEVEPRFGDVVDRTQRHCAAARETGRLEAIAEGRVSPVLPANFFRNQPPRVRLFRVRAR